jgi:hypothetical protein
MPETEPQPQDRNLFEEYIALLSDRAELQDKFDEGLADPDIEELYFDEIIALGGQIDEVSVAEGFTDSLIAGGAKAARALEQLGNPVLTRRVEPAVLEEKREPHRMRLEVAAEFLHDHAVETEEAVRVRAAAKAAGIQLVARAAFVVLPPEEPAEVLGQEPAVEEIVGQDGARDDEFAVQVVAVPENAAITPLEAARIIAAGTVVSTEPTSVEPDRAVIDATTPGNEQKETDFLDNYFTLSDAAVLVAGLSRFTRLLEQNGIRLPEVDASLYEHFDGGPCADAEALLRQRTEAVAKVGSLLQNTKLLVELLSNADVTDPRVELLLGLQESINHDHPERFRLIAELIEAEKILAVTLYTPRRSGPVVNDVAVRPSGLVSVDAHPETVKVLNTEPKADATHHRYVVNIEELTARLGEGDTALAMLCLAGAVQIRQHADASNLSAINEAFPNSYLADTLFAPGLQHAILEARKGRLIQRHIQHTGSATVREAIIAVLYQNPLLKEFMGRNRETVHEIVASVCAASAAEDV